MRHSIQKSILLLVGLIVAMGVVVACQSTGSSDPEPKGPLTAFALLTITSKDSSRVPDSADWSAGKQSGKGRLSCVEFACTDTLALSDALGSDSARIRFHKLGILIATYTYTQTGRSPDLKATTMSSRNDANLRLLAAFFEVRKSKVDSFAKLGAPTPAQLVAYYATLVYAKASGYTSFPDSVPVGMNADSVRKNLVRLAASFKLPWRQLAAQKWGLDSVSIRGITLELLRVGQISSSDSLALFPLPPVRLAVPVVVAGDLVVGGGEPSISGRFAWDSGMVSVAASVWRGSDSLTDGFDALLVAAPGLSDTSWSPSRLVLRAKANADTGRYVLRIVVSDSRGNSAVAKADFRVVPAPAGAPRLVRRLPVQQEGTVLPFDSAELRTEWLVRNPSNFDDTTFYVNGVRATKENDSTWMALVPLAPDGQEKIIAIKAKSKAGETLSDYVKAMRLRDTVGPVVAWVAPTSEMVVDYSVESFQAKVRATDPSGIDSVWIDGTPAALVDGSWQVGIRLEPTGVAREVKAVARDKAGNRSESTIHIGRGKDNIRPTVVQLSSVRVVPHDSTSVTLSWSVTDNQAVGRVTIDDSVASRSGDAYSRRVALKVGANRVALHASDTTGNVKLDTIVLVRAAGLPLHSLAERRYIGRMWDTLTSVDADSMEWSLDGLNWAKVAGPLSIDRSGIYQVRAWPGPSSHPATYVISDPVPHFGKSSNTTFFTVGDSLYASGWNAYGQIPGSFARILTAFTFVGVGYRDVFPAWSFVLYADSKKERFFNGHISVGTAGRDATTGADLNVNARQMVGWGGSQYAYLDDVGRVWARGMGVSTSDSLVFHGAKDIRLGQSFLAIRDSSNSLWVVGSGWRSNVDLPKLLMKDVAGYDVGTEHLILMNSAGDVFLAGHNLCGCMGVGDFSDVDSLVAMSGRKAVSVVADNQISAFIDPSGTLWATGANAGGAIISNSKACIASFTRIDDSVKWVSVGGAGAGFEGGAQPALPFMFYSKKDGSLWARGYSSYGALGVPFEQIQQVPIRIHF